MKAAELKVASITEDHATSNGYLNQSNNKSPNNTVSNGQQNDSLNSLVSNIPPLISNPSTLNEDPLEQAAKSLQKLYVQSVSIVCCFLCVL
jgi:hypothetical protein